MDWNQWQKLSDDPFENELRIAAHLRKLPGVAEKTLVVDALETEYVHVDNAEHAMVLMDVRPRDDNEDVKSFMYELT